MGLGLQAHLPVRTVAACGCSAASAHLPDGGLLVLLDGRWHSCGPGGGACCKSAESAHDGLTPTAFLRGPATLVPYLPGL